MNLFIYPKAPDFGIPTICKKYAGIFGLSSNTADFHAYEMAAFKLFIENHYLPSVEIVLKEYLSHVKELESIDKIDKLFELAEIKTIDEDRPDTLANKSIYVTYAPEFLKLVSQINDIDKNESKERFKQVLEWNASFYSHNALTEAFPADDAYVSIMSMFKPIHLAPDFLLYMAMTLVKDRMTELATSPQKAAEEFWVNPINAANLTEYKQRYETVLREAKPKNPNEIN